MTHEQRIKKSWTTVVARRTKEPLVYEIDGAEFAVRSDLDPFALITSVVQVAKAMTQLRNIAGVDFDISQVDDDVLDKLAAVPAELDAVQAMIRRYIVSFATDETRPALEGVIGNVGLHEGMDIIRTIRDELSPVDPTQRPSSADGSPTPGTGTTDTAPTEGSTPAL